MKLVHAFNRTAIRLLGHVSPGLEAALRRLLSRPAFDDWPYRTRQVMACPDNAHIARVPDAGEIVDGFQIMHNGLRINVGSYYGEGVTEMLRRNRGVHEPQEEVVFQEVLKDLGPGSLIVELGAYWAFYSMWFCKSVPEGRAHLIEPDPERLESGLRNFAANGLCADFTSAMLGRTSGRSATGMRVLCLDDFVAEENVDHITILHSDIQGSELEMLQGAERTLAEQRISYLFISTHSAELHASCSRFLRVRKFEVVTSVTPAESYSFDGVLVLRARHVRPIPLRPVSRRRGRRLAREVVP